MTAIGCVLEVTMYGGHKRNWLERWRVFRCLPEPVKDFPDKFPGIPDRLSAQSMLNTYPSGS